MGTGLIRIADQEARCPPETPKGELSGYGRSTHQSTGKSEAPLSARV